MPYSPCIQPEYNYVLCDGDFYVYDEYQTDLWDYDYLISKPHMCTAQNTAGVIYDSTTTVGVATIAAENHDFCVNHECGGQFNSSYSTFQSEISSLNINFGS